MLHIISYMSQNFLVNYDFFLFFFFYSSSRSHTSRLRECTARAADWTRWLQAQRHLCVRTYGQWQDSFICHTGHTGKLFLHAVDEGYERDKGCRYSESKDVCHQVLMERVVCEVRALAVLPTKELAQQV